MCWLFCAPLTSRAAAPHLLMEKPRSCRLLVFPDVTRTPDSAASGSQLRTLPVDLQRRLSRPPRCADPALQTLGRRLGRFHSETIQSCPQWPSGRGRERPLWVQSRRRRPRSPDRRAVGGIHGPCLRPSHRGGSTPRRNTPRGRSRSWCVVPRGQGVAPNPTQDSPPGAPETQPPRSGVPRLGTPA